MFSKLHTTPPSNLQKVSGTNGLVLLTRNDLGICYAPLPWVYEGIEPGIPLTIRDHYRWRCTVIAVSRCIMENMLEKQGSRKGLPVAWRGCPSLVARDKRQRSPRLPSFNYCRHPKSWSASETCTPSHTNSRQTGK